MSTSENKIIIIETTGKANNTFNCSKKGNVLEQTKQGCEHVIISISSPEVVVHHSNIEITNSFHRSDQLTDQSKQHTDRKTNNQIDKRHSLSKLPHLHLISCDVLRDNRVI